MIHNLKIKIKDLWTKVKYKLIKVLGGYTFPPVPPKIVKKVECNIVPVNASWIVNKDRYDKGSGYREYVKLELARILAGQIIASGMMSSETVVELNDDEYIVKVSAKLAKEDE